MLHWEIFKQLKSCQCSHAILSLYDLISSATCFHLPPRLIISTEETKSRQDICPTITTGWCSAIHELGYQAIGQIESNTVLDLCFYFEKALFSPKRQTHCAKYVKCCIQHKLFSFSSQTDSDLWESSLPLLPQTTNDNIFFRFKGCAVFFCIVWCRMSLQTKRAIKIIVT